MHMLPHLRMLTIWLRPNIESPYQIYGCNLPLRVLRDVVLCQATLFIIVPLKSRILTFIKFVENQSRFFFSRDLVAAYFLHILILG